MHVIFFGLKRAWHGCLRITRRPLTALGLTAARFDLLYALLNGLGTTQVRLRRALGVNRTTISRMLGSLESLGLIKRERVRYGDRRTRKVAHTEQGERRIRIAMRELIDSGSAKLAVDSAIAGDPWRGQPTVDCHNDMACFCGCQMVDSYLSTIRKAYGDSATLYYRWHPDD